MENDISTVRKTDFTKLELPHNSTSAIPVNAPINVKPEGGGGQGIGWGFDCLCCPGGRAFD